MSELTGDPAARFNSPDALSEPGDCGVDLDTNGEDGFQLVQSRNKRKAEKAERLRDNQLQPQTPMRVRLYFPEGTSPEDKYLWLNDAEDKYPEAEFQFRVGTQDHVLIRNDPAVIQDLLTNSIRGITMEQSSQPPSKKTIIIIGLDQYQTPTLLEAHPYIRRTKRLRGKNAVIADWVGSEDPPKTIRVRGAYRTLKVTLYQPPNRRCYNCQHWGHVARLCPSTKPWCGLCSRQHATQVCRDTVAQGGVIQQKCINCKTVGVPVWHPNCSRAPTPLQRPDPPPRQVSRNTNAARVLPTANPWPALPTKAPGSSPAVIERSAWGNTDVPTQQVAANTLPAHREEISDLKNEIKELKAQFTTLTEMFGSLCDTLKEKNTTNTVQQLRKNYSQTEDIQMSVPDVETQDPPGTSVHAEENSDTGNSSTDASVDMVSEDEQAQTENGGDVECNQSVLLSANEIQQLLSRTCSRNVSKRLTGLLPAEGTGSAEKNSIIQCLLLLSKYIS